MNNLVFSQITLRRLIGILAIMFPFLLILGTWTGGVVPLLGSLSAHYWSSSIVIFVGMLITFGIFLITYKGYDKIDEIITTISGIAMICIAIFPALGGDVYLFLFIPPLITHILHTIFAIIAFSFLGIMSFFQFTKHQGEMSKNKKKRNIIYRICGIIIFASILLMIPTQIFDILNIVRLFFWLESIVVWAFGISWLVKGKGLLVDKN
ncbi:MAG: hypothetical protein ACOC3V_02990 [bacterium]